MKIGTKSLLFGVHQFLWHPLTILLAWLKIHRRWPSVPVLICIVVHDWGYWGKADMDGPEGVRHPVRGAWIAARLAARWTRLKMGGYWPWASFSQKCTAYDEAANVALDTYNFCAFHSKSFAAQYQDEPSGLCNPDKASILFEPRWFYLLRARLTGELTEYVLNSKYGEVYGQPDELCVKRYYEKAWFDDYKNKIKDRLQTKKFA